MQVPIEPSVLERFPGLSLGVAIVEGVRVGAADAPGVVALRVAAQDAVRAARTLEGLKEDALFRAYRDFYWALRIDPTKTRPSGEALNRRVLQGKDLPSINAFVDAYNAASAMTGVPIGAYDADRLSGPLSLRWATKGEMFAPLAGEPRALEGGELVLADAIRVVNFYPYRDADHTKVTEASRRCLLVACGAPGVDPSRVGEAVRLAADHVLGVCGGRLVTTT